MSVTAKLALSQLRVNRTRTLGALTATALSAALITAVCSFVASGNAMLVNFLGEHYGEYGATYKAMLLIPAVIFGVLILAMSVVVISNVFRVSAGERVAQFGILKCVGATERQITQSVLHESVMLSAVGIPAGLALGLLLAFAGISVANHYLSDLNSLVNIMIVDIRITLDFVLSWQALLVSALVCFITVVFSAWLPARKAAGVSAVDCIRKAGEVRLERGSVRSNPLAKRLFGFEGELAARNLRRSRRSFRSTLIALSTGVVLFICLSTLSDQAAGMEELMTLKIDETVIAEYSSGYDREINKATGQEETVYLHPIDSPLGDALTLEMERYDGCDVYGMGTDLDRYSAIIPNESISPEMLSVLEDDAQTPADSDAQELRVEIVTVDSEHYAELCERAGVPLGSVILINEYNYNDNGYWTHIAPFSEDIKSVTLRTADGSTEEIEIQGVLSQEQIPQEFIYFNPRPLRLLLPEAQVRSYSWYAAPEDISGFIAYADALLDERFPTGRDADYMEDGFNTRVFRTDDFVRVMNLAIVLASVFLYSFVALLMLIGFTNVVSTLTTNVRMRSREFAVLQSVGMTPEGLRKMLDLESIICAFKALSYGVPIGLVISYLINLPIRAMYPVPFSIPWLSLLLCVLAVLLAILGTTHYAASRLKRQNIMETIRTE